VLDVTFYEDGRKRLSSFAAVGHAEFADAGEDVVCAAVSAILQAARLGLEEHERVVLDVRQERGDMRVTVPEERRDDEGVRAILTTAALSVRQIAAQYPQHVRYFSGKIGI
jgi:uncharacterized protein YsxB (DUF464 family)